MDHFKLSPSVIISSRYRILWHSVSQPSSKPSSSTFTSGHMWCAPNLWCTCSAHHHQQQVATREQGTSERARASRYDPNMGITFIHHHRHNYHHSRGILLRRLGSRYLEIAFQFTIWFPSSHFRRHHYLLLLGCNHPRCMRDSAHEDHCTFLLPYMAMHLGTVVAGIVPI